jgi:uncharacterized protein (DUF362 family)
LKRVNGVASALKVTKEGFRTVSKVAIVEVGQNARSSFEQALKLIGGIDHLNVAEKSVTIKLGVFDPETENHTSVKVVDAIINSFNKTPKIFLAESDNYRGKGSEKLQKWKNLFSKRVVPFNLSEDTDTRQVKVADEKIGLSHILFKPNVFVSTHILRLYEHGSIIKNLLGLVPDAKKVRFHKKLEPALLDMCEAIGGIDLAVLDGTHAAFKSKRIDTNILIVGRDAVAVETVGATLVGMNPEKMPLIQQAISRGLGEGNIKKIEVLGTPIESLKERFESLSKASKKKAEKSPVNKKTQVKKKT